jgi:hypothetical protein
LPLPGTPSRPQVAAGHRSALVQEFTTSGPGDPRIGLPLRAQFTATAFALGFINATYTNIVFEATPTVPFLSIQRTNTVQIEIAWATNFSSHILESAPQLGATWSAVTNVPELRINQRVVTLDVGSGSKFFRLRQP